jgi:hypothetical protein
MKKRRRDKKEYIKITLLALDIIIQKSKVLFHEEN